MTPSKHYDLLRRLLASYRFFKLFWIWFQTFVWRCMIFFPFVFERIKGWQIAQSTMTCRDVLWFFHVCESYPFGSMIFDQSLMWLRIDCERDLHVEKNFEQGISYACHFFLYRRMFVTLVNFPRHSLRFNSHKKCNYLFFFFISFIILCLFPECLLYLTECASGFMKWRSRRMFSFRDTSRIHHDGRRTFPHQRNLFFVFICICMFYQCRRYYRIISLNWYTITNLYSYVMSYKVYRIKLYLLSFLFQRI